MTREKEIEQAMKESVTETIYASGYGMTPQATDLLECAFTKGAKWADGTMIEKACEWLKTLTYQEFAGAPLERLITDELISEFRQAMKGE